MSIIAYCRTSTKGQCLEYQRKEIEDIERGRYTHNK